MKLQNLGSDRLGIRRLLT